jgi:hypothetical protein
MVGQFCASKAPQAQSYITIDIASRKSTIQLIGTGKDGQKYSKALDEDMSRTTYEMQKPEIPMRDPILP